MTYESGVALLDRASEAGLLSPNGTGWYTIHPALPWFFRLSFYEYWGHSDMADDVEDNGGQSGRAGRAFAEAMAFVGNYKADEYRAGHNNIIYELGAEEDNLLHALHLARVHRWFKPMVGVLNGLHVLYYHTGRLMERARLVGAVIRDLEDPRSHEPLRGLEEEWAIPAYYRVHLEIEARRWHEAGTLHRPVLSLDRQRAGPGLGKPPEQQTESDRMAIHGLAVSLATMGHILREQNDPECIEFYEQSMGLYDRIGDTTTQAVTALNLGHAYKNVPALKDLDAAERSYKRALELYGADDRRNQAGALAQLGLVAHQRATAGVSNGGNQELLAHLNAAQQFYVAALDLMPEEATESTATLHAQLGNIYSDGGRLDLALVQWREAIRDFEGCGDVFGAARTKFNVAQALRLRRRNREALKYALAALTDFQVSGVNADQMILEAKRIVQEIEDSLSPIG